MRIARFGPWRPPAGWQRLVDRGLRALLAQDNPDLDPAYEPGRVTREIGFDPSGRAVVAAPLDNNPGIFTDADQAPYGLGEPVSATEFERAWSELSARFAAGDRGGPS